jgi:hypothetical protein
VIGGASALPAHRLPSPLEPPMPTTMKALTTLAVLSVGVVLVLGLKSMLKGNSPNLSQQLMRWRIGLQFIAIVLIMLTVFLMRR